MICLSYGGFAFLSKLVRTSMLENLLSDFARTARAKGVREHDVLWRHVFRNGLLPLITVSAGILPALLGGSVIVETIFSIDGMGKLAVEAVEGTRPRAVPLAHADQRLPHSHRLPGRRSVLRGGGPAGELRMNDVAPTAATDGAGGGFPAALRVSGK